MKRIHIVFIDWNINDNLLLSVANDDDLLYSYMNPIVNNATLYRGNQIQFNKYFNLVVLPDNDSFDDFVNKYKDVVNISKTFSEFNDDTDILLIIKDYGQPEIFFHFHQYYHSHKPKKTFLGYLVIHEVDKFLDYFKTLNYSLSNQIL
ncbi:uncharacterized protein J8A68_003570 [[Candida] subhashii]|uniref:Uncharacterized protein n=1 Tax=[Candida] subhashii TaxID=561895 RepID=A0A8J5QDF7_9ASCO|nr:uncharacterized protein J8A68_003570 [[Candida] subhashii]KAG7662886.1 hypothetical protein J8A68_003570 [[Candida] subhashii]